MTNVTGQMRDWTGPAILTYGFRPFFLGGAVWAASAMAMWIAMLSGRAVLPIAFDPLSWHAHEFLYGYLGAVMAGFMLTAVPNWTGRLPVVGWRLGGLVLLWLSGRGAVAVSAFLPASAVAVIDLAFPIVLAGILGREIVAGRNWRNLVVLGMLFVFVVGNAVFHWEAAYTGSAADGFGLRIGLMAAVMMIAVIGGRIVPSFTRNWLAKRGPGRLPVPPMQRLDRLALLVLFAAVLLWVALPDALGTGVLLVLAGLVHLARLARWAGGRTLAEPLVTVLHIGYLFLPLGALVLGAEILAPGHLGIAASQHLWMGGAIGLMTLAVMTRATLGHTGRALSTGPGTVMIYAALVAAVVARVASGVWPEEASLLHKVSGTFWIGAFGGFTLAYGRLLLRRPPAKRV